MSEARVAWLFPGQGSQAVGMGRDLAAAHPTARRTFEEADDALGVALSGLMFEGPRDLLDQTINTQPALYVHSVALVRVGREEGLLPEPSFVAGHSLGEYSALTAAGALDFAAGLSLVRERGRLMEAAGRAAPGGMAAIIALDDATVAALCADASRDGEIVEVANYNCPGQVVVSGASAAVERLCDAAREAGARMARPLDVSIAAHSALMAPAAAALAGTIAETPIEPPKIPVIANVTARPMTGPDEIREELVAQLTGSVRWTDSIRYLEEQGVTRVIEIGQGNVLVGLARRIAPELARDSLSTYDDLAALGGA